jgi:hypothetical protein
MENKRRKEEKLSEIKREKQKVGTWRTNGGEGATLPL